MAKYPCSCVCVRYLLAIVAPEWRQLQQSDLAWPRAYLCRRSQEKIGKKEKKWKWKETVAKSQVNFLSNTQTPSHEM